MRYKDWTGHERTYFVNVPTFPITKEMVKRSTFKLIKAQRKLDRFYKKIKPFLTKKKNYKMSFINVRICKMPLCFIEGNIISPQ